MTGLLRRRLGVATIAMLALAATITTAGHDFTYDDRGVVLDNAHVHSLKYLANLFSESYWPAKYGGDGYRPFIVSLFSVEWFLGSGAPWVFHLVNIGLAVATALAVYWCATALLPASGAWVAAALFAVHPVHVEVTGNVVGQSELVVALCLTLAIGLYVRRRLAGDLTPTAFIAIGALYTVALFSKEHAVVLPAILVAAELTVLPGGGWRRRVVTVRPLLLALTMLTLGYFLARIRVQADLAGFMPYPIFRFLRMSAFDRIATMMNEMPRISQLLVFPTHLSADYSPNDVIVANGPDVSQLPGIVICLGTAIIALALRVRAPVASFGLVWIIVAYLPVSNFIVPAGFVTAERTLFFPSVGVVLVVGSIAEWVRRKGSWSAHRVASAALLMLLAASLARSIDRQRVWKNNDVFFEALMKDAPNGYRTHFLYARHVGLKSRFSEMEKEYRKSIAIFPYDASVTIAVADAYTRSGICGPAVTLFEWSFSVEPKAGDGRYQYVYCLAKLDRWADVQREALAGLPIVPVRDVKLMRAAVVESARQLRIRSQPLK